MPTLDRTEVEISNRLRSWREARLYAQTTFADAIGEGRERVASYEAGRVALRWEVFLKIWRRFGLSPQWLATEEGDISLPHEPFAYLVRDVPGGELFSRVYADILRGPIEKFTREHDAKLDEVMSELERRGLVNAGVSRLGRKIFRRTLQQMIAAGDAERSGETALDDVALLPHRPRMSNLPIDVDDLLDRVRSATAAPGAKKALAEWMEVEQQQVSRWLSPSGKRPSTDSALALLHWLSGAKAKPKKTPAVFEAQPARKAKAKPSRETKQSSGPPRK